MSTAADGTPPVMNMGLVTGTGRHTAFDSDVVFHEYTHGLTNRLVGGTRQGHTLDAPQSQGMGEGWSDFFALTIQNFFRAKAGQPERIVVGPWVINNNAGIRSNPYDDSYPFTYGNVTTFDRDPDTGLPDEHQTGEIWCAALLMMVRRIRAALGNDIDGYRLGWQIVVDGLKLNSSESVVPASARRDPACTRPYARPATDLANNPSGRTPSGAGGVRSVRDGAEHNYPRCGCG